MRNRIIVVALLMTACSKGPSHREEAPAGERAAPDIAIMRAPGVSLTYQYGFKLPRNRVAATQEIHAAQCEAASPARCRITGMTYQVHHDRTITASLAVKLSPDVARDYGKKGVAAVSQQGGMLVEARIDSEESGAVADAADRDARANAQERARIEQQLARPGLSSAERTQLQARLVELSDQRRQIVNAGEDARSKLADTPMVFSYVSGQVDPGLNDGPLLGAAKDGWANVVAGMAFLLTAIITLVPWAIAAIGLVALWLGLKRWAARRGLWKTTSPG